MRQRLLLLIALSVGLFFPSFTDKKECDDVPALNKQIVSFVKSKLNKKVGRGECWDLAAEALNSVGAKWDHDFAFGRPVDIKKECVYPGDIMQFEGVEVEYRDKNTFYSEQYDQHTAVIFEVKDKESFVMAEQNTSSHGKKVSLNGLELKNIRKGKFKLFRPVK
jgi:hypothetical protein